MAKSWAIIRIDGYNCFMISGCYKDPVYFSNTLMAGCFATTTSTLF